MIDFSLLNGIINVSSDGTFYKGFKQSSNNFSDFNADSNEAIITLDGQPFVIPLSKLTISGVAVTDAADFQSKIAVIITVSTASVATTTIVSEADDTAAYAALSNSQWGIFSIPSQDPTFYAKDATGKKFKLTLPAL